MVFFTRVLVYMLIPMVLFSAEYTDLKLPEALELAKKSNLELSISSLDVKIKSLEVREVEGKEYGTLNLIQNISRTNDAGNTFGFKLTNREAAFKDFGFNEFDMTNPNLLDTKPNDLNYPKDRNFFQTKLQYLLPIYTGGKLTQYKKIKESLKYLSTLQRDKIAKNITLKVKSIYGDIWLLHSFLQNLKIINDNVDTLKLVSQNMLKEGYAKKIDVLEVESRKANIQRMINQTYANKKLALQYLSFLTNSNIISVDTSSYSPPREMVVEKELLLNSNLDIQKAKTGHEIAKRQIKLSNSNFLPTAGLLAEYSSSDETFLDNFQEHDSYTIGLQIKWNLFNGGSDNALKEKYRVENLKAKERLEFAKSAVWLKANNLQIEIEKSKFDIESLEAELKLSKEIYENYLGRYQEKLVSIDDVIMKHSNVIELTLKLQKLQNEKYDKILELEELL